MKELMIHVERVVRPIRSLESRKDRMREELLTHLTSIFDEELARLGDRDAALQEAFRRLGDPAALTRELQATAPRQEAMGVMFERWFRPRRGEPVLRYAFRLSGLLAAYCAIVYLGASIITVQLPEPARDWPQRMWIGAVFLLFVTALVFPLTLLYLKMRGALCRGRGVARSWLRAIAWALLTGLVTLAFGLLMVLVSLGNLQVSLELMFVWYPFAVALPISLAAAALYFGPAQLRHLEWVNLEIGQ
jgi:hypothetical protein